MPDRETIRFINTFAACPRSDHSRQRLTRIWVSSAWNGRIRFRRS